MPDYCTCGAQLPPDARFCHKCGKPQYDYPNIEEPEPPPALPPPLPTVAAAAAQINFRNRAAVGIGFIVAVVALLALAFVTQLLPSAAWVFIGFFAEGMVAAFAYIRVTGQRLSIASGARMGWITGIFSFALVLALATAIVVAMWQGGPAARKQLPQGDPNAEQLLKILNDPSGSAALVIFGLLTSFVLLTTLTMLGGALAAKLSEKRA